jgi:hypothetical protein
MSGLSTFLSTAATTFANDSSVAFVFSSCAAFCLACLNWYCFRYTGKFHLNSLKALAFNESIDDMAVVMLLLSLVSYCLMVFIKVWAKALELPY